MSDKISQTHDITSAHPQPPYKELEPQQWPGSEKSMQIKPDFGLDSYQGHGLLQGSVAVITGADSGIGRAVALAFHREGAKLVISYLNEHEDAKEIGQVIEKEGGKPLLVPGDLTSEDECKKLIGAAVKAHGQIDLLVLNHAMQGEMVESIVELSRERVERTFMTNIISFFSLARLAIPHMKQGSSIITTGSVQAYQPSACILDYAVTKGAIVNFTKGLAGELVPKGIRVNCVAPGPVMTPLVVSSFRGEKLETFGSKYPIKRAAMPSELAGSYVYLACNAMSRYVNAEILAVTGGEVTA